MAVIRALTYHASHQGALTKNLLENKVLRFKDAIEQLEVKPWTIRLSLPSINGIRREEIRRIATIAGEISEDEGVMIAALPMNDIKLITYVFESIAPYPRLYASFLIERPDDLKRYLDLLVSKSDSPTVFTRLCLVFPRRVVTPYFPAACSGSEESVSVALRYVDLVREAITRSSTSGLAAHLQEAYELCTSLASSMGVKCEGVDPSISPWMEESSLSLVEMLSGEEFPGPGSSWAIWRINELMVDVAESSGVKITGFSELMLPVAEDNLLKKRVLEGKVRLWHLSSLSAYCVAGLDMVVVRIKGRERSVKMAMLDVYSAALMKNKPLGIRLIPTEAEDGEVIYLDKFGQTPVVSV